METLGHSQISLTLDTYSHVLPALGQRPLRKWICWLGSELGSSERNALAVC
jgi:hypothetical protein